MAQEVTTLNNPPNYCNIIQVDNDISFVLDSRDINYEPAMPSDKNIVTPRKTYSKKHPLSFNPCVSFSDEGISVISSPRSKKQTLKSPKCSSNSSPMAGKGIRKKRSLDSGSSTSESPIKKKIKKKDASEVSHTKFNGCILPSKSLQSLREPSPDSDIEILEVKIVDPCTSKSISVFNHERNFNNSLNNKNSKEKPINISRKKNKSLSNTLKPCYPLNDDIPITEADTAPVMPLIPDSSISESTQDIENSSSSMKWLSANGTIEFSPMQHGGACGAKESAMKFADKYNLYIPEMKISQEKKEKSSKNRELKGLYDYLNEISWASEKSFVQMLSSTDNRHSERITAKASDIGKNLRRLKAGTVQNNAIVSKRQKPGLARKNTAKLALNRAKYGKPKLLVKSVPKRKVSFNKINAVRKPVAKPNKLNVAKPNKLNVAKPNKLNITKPNKLNVTKPNKLNVTKLNKLNVTKSVTKPNKLDATKSVVKSNKVNVTKSVIKPQKLDVAKSVIKPNKINVEKSVIKSNKINVEKSVIKQNQINAAKSVMKRNQINAAKSVIKRNKIHIAKRNEKLLKVQVKSRNMPKNGPKVKSSPTLEQKLQIPSRKNLDISDCVQNSSGNCSYIADKSGFSSAFSKNDLRTENGGKMCSKNSSFVKKVEKFEVSNNLEFSQSCSNQVFTTALKKGSKLRVRVKPLEHTKFWNTEFFETFKKKVLEQAFRETLDRRDQESISTMFQELQESCFAAPNNMKLPKKKKQEEETLRSSARQSEGAFRYKEIVVKKNENYMQFILVPNASKRNSLTIEAMKELREAFLLAKKDSNCRAVLLNSSGTYFCTGIDLSVLVGNNKKQAAEEMASTIKDLVLTLSTFTKPVIAAVNGTAVGFGVSLLTYCDVVLASDKATFCIPATRLGYLPEGAITLTLPQVVGSGVATEMLLYGRRLTAEQALRHGLVSEVLWPTQLMNEVVPRIQTIVSQPLQVMEATKMMVRCHLWDKLKTHIEREWRLLPPLWLDAQCQHNIKRTLQTGWLVD